LTQNNIVIRPDPRLGQPGPLAHKIFVALIKKHSGYGRPIQNDVSFTKRELMRLIGRAEWGGSASEQLTRALNEIHHAFVRTNFKIRDNRYAEHSFNIFPEVYLERAERSTDPVETCTVTLARPIIASLQDEHFTCLNHFLMQRLSTIGQALYMRLFFHFANLYDGHHKSRLAFPKRYDDICAEWLGGLAVHRHLSTIERDQLGSHIRQLVREGFLASYHIAKARNGDGFVITFRPGEMFFADYDRFYRHRERGELQFEFHGDRRDVAEPLKVAYLFAEKRTGRPRAEIGFVPSTDVENAKTLLKQVSFDEIPDFLDFALAEAKRTRFDVQTLGGLKQYVAGYRPARERQAAGKASSAAVEAQLQQTQDRMTYDAARRAAGRKLYDSLSADERTVIDDLARSQMPRGTREGGSLAETMFTIEKARIASQRHPDQIPTFEQWQARRAA
jgi:hypothetical protein